MILSIGELCGRGLAALAYKTKNILCGLVGQIYMYEKFAPPKLCCIYMYVHMCIRILSLIFFLYRPMAEIWLRPMSGVRSIGTLTM